MQNTTPERSTMNGKPVYFRAAKTVLTMDSGFKPKLLCDGPVFSTGDACAYSCQFCYVAAQNLKLLQPLGFVASEADHFNVVVRRHAALDILREQLTVRKNGIGRAKYDNENDQRVVYASPHVDVAANMELLRETADACAIILSMTHWHIRLLTKSNLLDRLPTLLFKLGVPHEEIRRRMIFGVSTGTLDDDQAAAFECGTAKVSKRLESLHRLQDEGFRTFGMICPSLPQRDYDKWAWDMALAIRANLGRCEHVWAEVMNARGDSLLRTCKALHSAGYEWQSAELHRVSTDKAAWEEYSRQTFLAHIGSDCYGVNQGGPGTLRFLQYITPQSKAWWKEMQPHGAVLLGAAAHE